VKEKQRKSAKVAITPVVVEIPISPTTLPGRLGGVVGANA
jgi:hypothetical protein